MNSSILNHQQHQKKPKQFKLKSYLFHLSMFLLFLSGIQTTLWSQEKNKTVSNIIGDWEGNIIINENKSVGILWYFEESNNQVLNSVMGPASKGIAILEMQDLQVTNTTLSFSIQSEGKYTGTISSNEIKGTWTTGQGKSFVLNMSRELTEVQLLERTGNTLKINDIHQYIELGNTAKVASFLKEGNDINKIYDKGVPLLFYAIKNDRSGKVASYLLEQGADPNIELEGITPLMFAVGYQKHKIIKELLNYGVAIDRISSEKETALSFAIRGRDVKAIQLLLDNGANPELEISKGYTAIGLAKEENDKEISALFHIPYEGVSDGPYITKDASGFNAVWIYKGKKYSKKVNPKKKGAIAYKGMQASLKQKEPLTNEALAYQGDFKIAAISDIHGQYNTFITLLKNNGIINKKGAWNFGNGHFIITGDIFDRGTQVTEVLWFLYDLEEQAAKKGGKVHVLLGNHDVMVLNGNLRAIHPKYKEVAQILDRPVNSLFSQESILGSWLRTKPVAIKVNGLLFAHGGFHPDLVSKGVTLEVLNREFQEQLVASELPEVRNDLGNYLHKGNGPIYYRGYFQGDRATSGEIDQLLHHFKASTIIVGHTTHRNIETRYQGKVIVIDANLKSGKAGEILLWNSGKFTRGTLQGTTLPLHIESN